MNRLSSFLRQLTSTLSNQKADHLSTLPPELLYLILTHLPTSSCTSLRLTSTYFSHSPILFTHLFTPLLKTWLSEKESHRMISSTASDLVNRPSVMWSPWAMEEELDDDVETAMLLGNTAPFEVKEAGEIVFLGIIWRLLLGYEFDIRANENGKEDRQGKDLTFEGFGEMSGRVKFTEKRLRMGRSRFLLYRKLMEEGEEAW